jgi:competence protein ComEA
MLGTRKTTSTKASERLKRALEDWKIAPEPQELMAPDAKRPGARANDPEPEPRFRIGRWEGRSIRPLFFIVGATLSVVPVLWFLGRPGTADPTPSGDESELVLDAPSSTVEVIIHVAGSVKNPGLYRLSAGARVADAVEAAGGVTKKKAANSVNLAREVVDGEQILVGESEGSGGEGAGISINSGSKSELEGLPGVGPAIAARIVSYRETNGPFTSIDALGDVSGIGEAILGSIRDIARL